jgi:hypothetical protein
MEKKKKKKKTSAHSTEVRALQYQVLVRPYLDVMFKSGHHPLRWGTEKLHPNEKMNGNIGNKELLQKPWTFSLMSIRGDSEYLKRCHVPHEASLVSS